MTDVRDVLAWAHRELDSHGHHLGQRLVRVEVGTGLLDALKATANVPDDGLPRSSAALLGVPLTAHADLRPMAWRTYDQFGRIIACAPDLDEAHRTADEYRPPPVTVPRWMLGDYPPRDG